MHAEWTNVAMSIDCSWLTVAKGRGSGLAQCLNFKASFKKKVLLHPGIMLDFMTPIPYTVNFEVVLRPDMA